MPALTPSTELTWALRRRLTPPSSPTRNRTAWSSLPTTSISEPSSLTPEQAHRKRVAPDRPRPQVAQAHVLDHSFPPVRHCTHQRLRVNTEAQRHRARGVSLSFADLASADDVRYPAAVPSKHRALGSVVFSCRAWRGLVQHGVAPGKRPGAPCFASTPPGGGWSPPRIAGSLATCWLLALRRLQVNASRWADSSPDSAVRVLRLRRDALDGSGNYLRQVSVPGP
jgi:hypothetical protein